jgi:plastocyanin
MSMALVLGTVAACSSSTSNPPGGGGNGGTTTTTTSTTTGTTSTTSTTTGTAQGGAGGMGGAGGQAGAAQGGAGGAATVNGCERATATDRTADAIIDLTWSLPHHECLLVAAGTEVRWTGNFTAHPLAGGVVPVADDTSPITLATPSAGVESVTFSQAGDYPYFCEVHTTSMEGVIYVQ